MLKHGKYLSIQLVDLCLAVVKSLGATRMMKSLIMCKRIQVRIIKNVVIKAGTIPGDSHASCSYVALFI